MQTFRSDAETKKGLSREERLTFGEGQLPFGGPLPAINTSPQTAGGSVYSSQRWKNFEEQPLNVTQQSRENSSKMNMTADFPVEEIADGHGPSEQMHLSFSHPTDLIINSDQVALDKSKGHALPPQAYMSLNDQLGSEEHFNEEVTGSAVRGDNEFPESNHSLEFNFAGTEITDSDAEYPMRVGGAARGRISALESDNTIQSGMRESASRLSKISSCDEDGRLLQNAFNSARREEELAYIDNDYMQEIMQTIRSTVMQDTGGNEEIPKSRQEELSYAEK